MGASLGAFDDTRDPDNPDGYAEHPLIRGFNDRLLGYLGASWDNWGFRASSVDFDTPELGPWKDEAVQMLRDTFAGPGPFVLKDPRLTTLAPFWERVVPAAGFYLRRIVILRDPAEVAESQVQRVARRPQEFPVIAAAEPMAALWVVSMHEVLSALGDDNTMVVSHADLLRNPAQVLAAIAPFAGLSPSVETVAAFALDGVKPSLYRAHVSEVSKGPWMAAAQAFVADFGPACGPRSLTRSEARAIIDKQTGLVPLMSGLSAARDSIFRMRESQALHQQTVTDITHYVWILAPLIAHAPSAQLSSAIKKARELAEETPLERSSFAFGHSLTRLYISAGLLDEAANWLDRLRPHFGHVPAYSALEHTLAEARKAQDTPFSAS